MYADSGRRSFVESLEQRTFLSASSASAIHADVVTPSAHIALHVSRHVAKLAQTVSMSVQVTAKKKFGPVAGSIEFLNHGTPIQAATGTTLQLTLDAKGRTSYAFGVGDVALYAGKNAIRAAFVSSNSLPNALSPMAAINVTIPRLDTASDGLQTATIIHGHGKGAVAGQMAAIDYTGFLTSDNSIFDYGPSDLATGLTFPIESSPEQVISGVDQGVLGMKMGETRVVAIPAALGFGANGSGVIPPNANLLFMMKLIALT